MYARVYDKNKGIFFKSSIYAKINKGYFEKYLVLMPKSEGGHLKMYDYLDKPEPGGELFVNINIIHCEHPDEWVEFDSASEEVIGEVSEKDDMQIDKLNYYLGYKSIWENKNALSILLEGGTIHPSCFNLKATTRAYDDEWTFIDTEKDVNALMEACYGFHDAVIVSVHYVSGAGKHGNKPVVNDSIRRISILFDTCWCSSLELVFEGVLSLNLRPAMDNCSSDIYTASLIIKDAVIYFAVDDIIDTINISDKVTWISALSLRWRFLEDMKQ